MGLIMCQNTIYLPMFSLRSTAFFSLLFGLAATCRAQPDTTLPASGVPYTLARQRSAIVTDVRYELFFGLPATKADLMVGGAMIRFSLARVPAAFLALDFKS